jgi:hypothetical protein
MANGRRLVNHWTAFALRYDGRLSRCRESTECREAHLGGFAAPLTHAKRGRGEPGTD